MNLLRAEKTREETWEKNLRKSALARYPSEILKYPTLSEGKLAIISGFITAVKSAKRHCIFRFARKSQVKKVIFIEFAVSRSSFLLKSRIAESDHWCFSRFFSSRDFFTIFMIFRVFQDFFTVFKISRVFSRFFHCFQDFSRFSRFFAFFKISSFFQDFVKLFKIFM